MSKLEDTPILLLPGWRNSGAGHWQTAWETEFLYTRVLQENWETPSKEAWIAQLSAAISAQASPPVLVAHSLGCHLVAAWASALSGSESMIKGALLVAPADLESPSAPQELSDFSPMVRQRLPFPSIVLASSNDPFANLEAAKKIADSWGAEFECLGDLGHINADSSLGDWAEGQSFLRRLVRGPA